MLAGCDQIIEYRERKNSINADTLHKLPVPEIVIEVINSFKAIFISNKAESSLTSKTIESPVTKQFFKWFLYGEPH